MDRREEARQRRERRVADEFAASEGWKWYADGVQGALASRIGGVASGNEWALEKIRYEQGYIAGLEWALAQPEHRSEEAEHALEQLEGDDNE